ncbi:RNA polymerase sigma factor [Echinicola arenosa]|nr:sigma-70 family RNA polymerase sigma factor [Echinicola arenosa]
MTMNNGSKKNDGEFPDKNTKWESIKNNDKKALLWVYENYAEQMLGYGMSLFGDREVVKDGIQEVFVSLWKYRHQFQGIDNIKAYLFKTLRTKILKGQQKSLLRKPKLFFTETTFVDHETTIIEKEHQELLRAKLKKGMEVLPPREKEVIRNLFFENLSYEDTSYIMEINVRSVYTLAWKAISRLKKHLHILLIIYCLLHL